MINVGGALRPSLGAGRFISQREAKGAHHDSVSVDFAAPEETNHLGNYSEGPRCNYLGVCFGAGERCHRSPLVKSRRDANETTRGLDFFFLNN